MTWFTKVNIALQSLNTHLNETTHLADSFVKVAERQVISPGLQSGARNHRLIFHPYNARIGHLLLAISNSTRNGLMIDENRL